MTPDEVRPAIENAYSVFAQYRLGPGLIDFAAAVGVSDEENERLRQTLVSVPVRLLPLGAVHAYFDYVDAAHYGGNFRASEFRYFLPRALELIALNGDVSTSWLRDCVERGLSRASARIVWPVAEIAAIDRGLACDPWSRVR